MTEDMNRARRHHLARWAACAVALAGPGWAAAARMATPAQAMGPFYPLQLPLDQDNDLTRVQGRDGTAFGEIIDVVGQVSDVEGRPLAGVRLEIWQVNGHGRYHHPHDDQDKPLDPNFQGFGHTITAADGGYRFRTVKPVAYPGRAPHIHFAMGSEGARRFFTQMYLAGATENASDFLLQRLSPTQQQSLVVALRKEPTAGAAASARFDIVLGKTVLSRRP